MFKLANASVRPVTGCLELAKVPDGLWFVNVIVSLRLKAIGLLATQVFGQLELLLDLYVRS